MGMTYTLCYCTHSRKCKSRFGEKKTEMFDEAHWGEVSENFNLYLAEDICVPGSSKIIIVPEVFVDLLNKYITELANVREMDVGTPPEALEVLARLHEAVSRISYLCHQIVAAPRGTQIKLSAKLQKNTDILPSTEVAANSDDRFMLIADVIVRTLHRSLYELIESKKTNDDIYIFHHLALVFDATQELYRLTADASSHLSSERFLPQEHKHYQVLEDRWERDGV